MPPKRTQARKQTQSRPKPRRGPGRAASASPRTALMRIAAPPAQPWNLTQEEVGLIKNHVAKGATDEELKFCLAVARRRKLDPFKAQIWFVKRRDKTAEGGSRWVPMTSIDGLLHVAARDHKDFGSSDEPEFGPMKEIKWSYFEKSGKFMAPEWARVGVWKKGASRPTVATVYWDEIYPDAGAAPMVREKPRLMLGKCALAQATRKSYPDTGGLYIPEEFQGPPEFTLGGRVMEVEQPKPDCNYCGRSNVPNGCDEPTCPMKRPELQKLTPAQVEVVKEKTQQASAPRTDAAKPVLTYIWFDASSTARIDPPTFELMADMKAILKKLVKQGKLAPNGEELDALKYECEKRGIELKRRREPGSEG